MTREMRGQFAMAKTKPMRPTPANAFLSCWNRRAIPRPQAWRGEFWTRMILWRIGTCGRGRAGDLIPWSKRSRILASMEEAMSNRFARTFLVLFLGCSVVAGYSPSAFAEKAKQTVKTQKQEDACVFTGATCLKSCNNTPQMTGKAFCGVLL